MDAIADGMGEARSIALAQRAAYLLVALSVAMVFFWLSGTTVLAQEAAGSQTDAGAIGYVGAAGALSTPIGLLYALVIRPIEQIGNKVLALNERRLQLEERRLALEERTAMREP